MPFIYRFLKNLCTDLSEPVPLDGVDPSALYRLAEKHFIGPGKLINTDDAVMEFQRKGAASLGKSEAVGDMVIALLRLLRVAMSVKNPAGTGKSIFFGNIKIQISQLPIFGGRKTLFASVSSAIF